MERELSKILGYRKVDLRTPQELSKYFRNEVLAQAEVQYAAAWRYMITTYAWLRQSKGLSHYPVALPKRLSKLWAKGEPVSKNIDKLPILFDLHKIEKLREADRGGA